MNRKQLNRLGWVFLVLAIVFYYSNATYGCNPSFDINQLPLSEYDISCLVAREVYSPFIELSVVLCIAFWILARLEPKDKKAK